MSKIALFVNMLGSVLIGLTVLRVHRRVMREERIDAAVLKEMRREQRFAALGIALIVIGFLLNLIVLE